MNIQSVQTLGDYARVNYIKNGMNYVDFIPKEDVYITPTGKIEISESAKFLFV